MLIYLINFSRRLLFDRVCKKVMHGTILITTSLNRTIITWAKKPPRAGPMIKPMPHAVDTWKKETPMSNYIFWKTHERNLINVETNQRQRKLQEILQEIDALLYKLPQNKPEKLFSICFCHSQYAWIHLCELKDTTWTPTFIGPLIPFSNPSSNLVLIAIQ